MREIKFRAWNNVKKEWVHTTDGACNILGEMILLGGWMHGVKLEELNDIIVEQFTGLRDKNGKEIYDGDIVSAILGTQGCGAINRKERSFNFVINWFKNGFEWSGLSPHDRYRFYPGFDKCEVIGNIHDNPELLKGQNSGD